MTEQNYSDTAIGIGAGYAVKKYSEKLLKEPYVEYLKNYRKNFFNEADNQIFKQRGLEAFARSGLEGKGVKLVDINLFNFEAEHAKIFGKNASAMISECKEAANGERAFFHLHSKSVVVNCDKRASSLFHEMGHAQNKTSTGWKHKLFKIRLFARPAAFAALMAGLCTDKESFFNENCGKLTFAAFLPQIAEEALASKNGQNMAKDVLSSGLLKKLKSINARSLGSYIAGAIASSIAAACAVAVKNKIAEASL